MDERKRPSPYDQVESAPPLKKHQSSANGASKAHKDDDMPWKDDLERFQKDAIYRQMQEYRREKNTLETQLKEMRKKTRYHDDHLRIIDSWFQQVVDEVKLVSKGADDDVDMESSPLPSSLLFSDLEHFEEHLRTRSREIRTVISRLFAPSRSYAPDVTELQSRVSRLLAAEKSHVADLSRLHAEKEDLENRLENASLRYMMAEKKIDRAKSVTVAKLEKQALLGATKTSAEEGGQVKREDSTVNGTTDNSEELAELEKEMNKAIAASEKQKQHLDRLEEENNKLTSQLTELSTKSTLLTDEDYAKTELFKQLKSQHEDVIKKINNLEATNVELREEAQKLRAERTAFQTQLENESRSLLTEKESLLTATEATLTRIRHNRDELLADQAVKKATLDEHQEARRKIEDLLSAQQDRIQAFESENERLAAAATGMAVDSPELDSLTVEDLRAKFTELSRSNDLLKVELGSMSTAFTKASKIASQKVSDFAILEEKVVRLSAEKAKADQKYFAAMKSKDTRDGEIRTLRLQNSKSGEAVSALKEAEAASRVLLTTLEKQLSELKEVLINKTTELRTVQQQNITQGMEVSRLQAQVTELKGLLSTKDTKLASTSSLCRAAEVEVEELKSSLKDTRRNLDSWKNKSGQSEQYEMLRQVAYCNICKRALKNTVIKTCGHTFCNDCVEERLTSRSRKCPNCGKSFGSNDHMRITL